MGGDKPVHLREERGSALHMINPLRATNGSTLHKCLMSVTDPTWVTNGSALHTEQIVTATLPTSMVKGVEQYIQNIDHGYSNTKIKTGNVRTNQIMKGNVSMDQMMERIKETNG